MRKLDDLAVEAVRDRFATGETVATLAAEFGLSERHVRRLTADVEPVPPRLEVGLDETVEAALARFLAGVDGDRADDVRAAAAMALARRLDRADPRPAAPLARALTDVLADIRGEREPDAVDGLRRRRDARRLAVAAAGGTVHNEGGAA